MDVQCLGKKRVDLIDFVSDVRGQLFLFEAIAISVDGG